MRRLLCLLLFCATSAVGQPAPGPAPASPARYTADDTVAALHRLFQHRRRTGTALLLGAGAVVVGTQVFSTVAIKEPTGIPFGNVELPRLVLGLAYSAPLWVASIAVGWGHGKDKEEQVVADYRARRVLPRRLSRRLRPKLFLRPDVLPPRR